MSMQRAIGRALSKAPLADAWFRRLVWSRIHFPEDELRLLSALPGRPADVAIDVGGALGSYAWLFNRKARRVLVFEPGRHHASFLSKAAPFSRIELHRAAVGNAPGRLALYTPTDDVDGRHSATLSTDNPNVDPRAAMADEVEVVTIDGITSQALRNGERVDLLKVDVEGFELAVFEGGKGRIEADSPLIFCEIEARHNARYREVFEMLRSLGYSIYYSKSGQLTELRSLDISPLQTAEALAYRLSGGYTPGTSSYINNFVFEHPRSRVKVSTGL
jgi:FkbM family methyltransferase